MLILGAVFAMITCDLIAIIFGKALSRKISDELIQKFSGVLFLIFGLLGILSFIF